jgi:hypothetical protein
MSVKSTFKRWDGSAWVVHYFATTADLVNDAEVGNTTKKFATSVQLTAIDTYLSTFNAANKLLKLDGSGLIPIGLIPGGLDYLTTNNPTFTGTMTGSTYRSAANVNLSIGRQDVDTTVVSKMQITRDGSGNREFKLEHGSSPAAGHFVIRYDATAERAWVDVNEMNIINLATPTANADAATKGYVDGLVGEGVRPVNSVRAATTANITLSGVQTIDGISVGAGDRVLVKNQTTTTSNGIYVVASGAWTKNAEDSLKGGLVFVESGTVNNDSKWYAESNTSWIKFSQVDEYLAGTGLTKTGTTFSIANGAITDSMLAGSITWGKLTNDVAVDNLTWAGMTLPSIDKSLVSHLGHLYSAIRRIRSDSAAAFNVNNSQNLAEVYDIANAKNRTYTTEPLLANRVTGDIFLETI